LIIFLEKLVDTKKFVAIRKRLNKTQKQMAQLLGTSVKAIHSYEQGWRSIPIHAERQIYFLLSRINGSTENQVPCWVKKKCPFEQKSQCPAWEFQVGDLCWFINGTICQGVVHKDWREKIKICKSCECFPQLFDFAKEDGQVVRQVTRKIIGSK
jgi:putative transcriptional regulator